MLIRAETIALLRARIPALDEELAGKLAAELGDLPLAAAQAAGYLEQTDLPPADYLRRFREHRETLLARGEVVGYAGRLDTAWALSLNRLSSEDPAAVQLLELAAFLASEPIPLALFGDHADLLDEPLRGIAADPDALADTLGALVGYSLARRHPDGFQVHRLVQAAVRHQLAPHQRQAVAERVLALLAAAHPGDPEDPAGWADYAALAPHVLATAPLADHSSAVRRLVLDTARYLQARGDSRGCRAVTKQLLDRWRTILGPDHPDTLAAAGTLTLALVSVSESEPARTLGEDTLQRCRRALGPDHPTSLWTAVAVMEALVSVSEVEPARTLGEDTLARCRRAFSPDHPTTLWAASSLTFVLVGLGETEPARALGEDTLARCRRAFGPDHGSSLLAAAALTLALVGLGEVEPARALGEDTLRRCRRVLGPDHYTSLQAATALTLARQQLGDVEPARILGEDTLARSRRAFGPDHGSSLLAAAALTLALVGLGEVEPARALGEDTLRRCRRVLGPDQSVTLLAAAALTAALGRLNEAEAARALGEGTLARCLRVLGPDHRITLYLTQVASITPEVDRPQRPPQAR